MKIKFTDMPKGLLGTIEDGTITLNSRHLVEIDEVFHDDNGEPTAQVLTEYYSAMGDYYDKCQ